MNLKKFLLSLFMLVATMTTVFAQGNNQKVTLEFKNIPLDQAMDKIKQQTGYIFSYDATKVDLTQKVSVSAKNITMYAAMHQMLKTTNLSFSINKNVITLEYNQDAAAQRLVTSGKNKKISGVVTDENGDPVIGATVQIKGTVKGVVTDLDGKYSMEAPIGATLEFRYVGYRSVEKKVGKDNNINITMAENNENLDEVVVIGYGTQQKESVVSAVNSVKPEQLAIPTRSLSNMIAGQVAGVIAVQRTGEPGNDNSSFWIRGISSFKGGTNPLILVDGVPRDMNDIDVDEIDNFTVLKDAAATAVYGSEGANGVILITTKRGRAQKTQISFNAQYSIQTPDRMPELMPSYDYLSMWNEASWNDAGNPAWDTYNKPMDDATIEKYRTGEDPDLYPNSNWIDLMSKHTHNQRYTVNFRGGSEKFRFFVSGAYYQEDGIFKSNPLENYDANIDLKRYNLRSNIDMDITSTTKLSVDMSGQYKTKNNTNNSSDAIWRHIVIFPTHLVPMVWSDGRASIIQSDADGRYNPYNMLNYTGYQKNWDTSIQTRVRLEQKLDFITKGLSIQGSLSFDAQFKSAMKRTMNPDKYYIDAQTPRNEDGSLNLHLKSAGTPLGDFAYASSEGERKIYIETQLNYHRVFAKRHDVTGVLVYNQKETQKQGYEDINGLTLLPYRKQNVVGRGSYVYDGRYVLEASFGATGSENFSEGHRWGVFPAVGAAWNMHMEKFMQNGNMPDYISKLRLRASYGITGNDDTGAGNRFPYREKITNSGSTSVGLKPGSGGGAGGTSYSNVYEGTFAAPSLTWETEKKMNVGIDLGLFRGRIDITADYFSNRREDILLQRVTIPTITGFRTNPWQNFGITTNKGFDASLVAQETIGDWSLQARGNFTYAKNKYVEMDEIPQEFPWMAQTGTSLGVNKIYIADGLFTPNDFIITKNNDGSYNYELKPGIPTYDKNVKPGDIKYRDLDGDGQINSSDQTYYSGIYPNNPQIVYGFGVNVGYKGFMLGVFFQGQAKASTNMAANADYYIPFYKGRDQSSARVEAADHWNFNDPYNQDVIYPRLHTNNYANNTLSSTWWYRSGAFLRLKNVELSYRFDKRIAQKLRMTNLRVYVQGSNLAVWDHIKQWDPGLGSSGAKYPICSSWTFGLDVAF